MSKLPLIFIIEVIKSCQQIIEEWLKDIGLELKPSKTKLTHTLITTEEKAGFEFLGFHIQQHKTGNYRCAKTSEGKLLGFNTLITPFDPMSLVTQVETTLGWPPQ